MSLGLELTMLLLHLIFDCCIINPIETYYLQNSSVVVSFKQTSYTVTEGKDEFVKVTLVRSGDLSRKTTVTLTTFNASALGKLHTCIKKYSKHALLIL